jgi:hypothetical protein
MMGIWDLGRTHKHFNDRAVPTHIIFFSPSDMECSIPARRSDSEMLLLQDRSAIQILDLRPIKWI